MALQLQINEKCNKEVSIWTKKKSFDQYPNSYPKDNNMRKDSD